MAQQQQSQGSDNSYGLIWVMVFTFALSALIWYAGKAYIVSYFFKIKYYEAQFLGLFWSKFQEEAFRLRTVDPSTVELQELIDWSVVVGNVYRYPVMVILFVLAYFLYNKNIKRKFSTRYSTKRLAAEEVINWPQIAPVVGIDLVATNLMSGPWAMSLNPLEFAEKHDLLDISYLATESFGAKEVQVTLKKDLAKQVFIEQLGPHWTDVNALPPEAKALFAMFASRINRDRESVDKLNAQIALSSHSQHLDVTGADALVQKYIDSKLVQKVIDKHAYVLTVMASMLNMAREDGVVASSDFLWLKPRNRTLWYLLNSIGRQTPYSEVGGPFAHWVAELKYNQKIRIPMIDTAVKALEIALSEIKYVPKEE